MKRRENHEIHPKLNKYCIADKQNISGSWKDKIEKTFLGPK